MGTYNSHYHEWIELYNPHDHEINLSGWKIKSLDDKFSVLLSGFILPKSFYLLERTGDDIVPNITADQIYTGSLKNSGMQLVIVNSQGATIEEINCSEGWFWGDNETKQTMERKSHRLPSNSVDSWKNSLLPLGTPKSKNSLTNKNSSSSQTSTANIIISEIMPSPYRADNTGEWIELENKNDFLMVLKGWSLSDGVGKTNTYVFSEKAQIPPHSFLVLPRTKTKIVLNNQGDELFLKTPEKEIVSKAIYEKALLGEAYALTEAGWRWCKPSPGSSNISLGPSALTSDTQTALPIKKLKNKAPQQQTFTPFGSFYYILGVALFVSFVSGIIVVSFKTQRGQRKKD